MNRTIYRTAAERESQEDHRRNTSRVLHAPTVGIAKLVGASTGLGHSRVRNIISGSVANPLEILEKWIDRLEREGVDAELIDAIPAWLAARRGGHFVRDTDAATPAAEVATIAAHLEQSAHFHARAVEAAGDGIDAREAEALLPFAKRHTANAQALENLLKEARKTVAADPRTH